MDKRMIIQELAIVVAAKNHNPTLLNPDFLKYNKIVPPEWELAENPICAELMARVVYKNRITIQTEFARVVFLEMIAGKNPEDVETPKVGIKYIETLPHVDYNAVGINAKGYVLCDYDEEGEDLIRDRLVADGPWMTFFHARPSVGLRFAYPLDDGVLNLNINTASLVSADKRESPIVAFESNFHRSVEGDSSKEKVDRIRGIIESWEMDLKTLVSLVEKAFLANEVKV